MNPIDPLEPLVTFRTYGGEAAVATLVHAQLGLLTIEIYKGTVDLSIGDVLQDVTVRSGDEIVYSGEATVCNCITAGSASVAAVVLPGNFPVTPSMRWPDSSLRSELPITKGYEDMVGDFRAFLGRSSAWIHQVDLATALPKGEGGCLRGDVFAELCEPFLASAQPYLERLEQEAQLIAPSAVISHGRFAQKALHPLLLSAPFAYRAFTKPMGYAGDYAMVSQILGDPRQGGTTYAQLVNTLFLKTAVAQAHRNRIDMLTDHLHQLASKARQENRPLRVLSVGCGPAAEVQRFVAESAHPHLLSFVLVDFSETTLNYTHAQLDQLFGETGKTANIKFVNESVYGLLHQRSAVDALLDEGTFDFAYCAGLFDYLSDKICRRLLRLFSTFVGPTGLVLASNVHTCNPQKAMMEHVLDWHLIYRDEETLEALLPAPRGMTKVYLDATGVNVFAEFQAVDLYRPCGHGIDGSM